MERSSSIRVRLFQIVVPFALVALVNGNAAAGQIGFVYALRQVQGGANQIYGFRFDQTTAVLTLLPGFPMASGGTGDSGLASEQLAYADGRLYVLNDGDNTMTAFSMNRATGALTAMPFSPIALGSGGWTCVSVHPSGSPVVVGNGDAGALASFVVTDTTATAAGGSPFATGAAALPYSCRFTPDGTTLYAGGNNGTSVAGFSVNPTTGVLAALGGSPFNSGGNLPKGYATDASGRLFSAMSVGGEVRAFTPVKGALTGVKGNPFPSGLTFGVHGVLHPGGFYMAADLSGDRVGSYVIAGTGLETTLKAVGGSPFSTGGTSTNALVLTPDGGHLLVSNGTSRNLTVFLVNQSSGTLTSLGVQAQNTLGASGAISGLVFAAGEAGFVYALQNVDSGSYIHGFRINPSTGALSALAGFPIASGGNGSIYIPVEQMAYRNGRLYVVNRESHTLTAFKVNRTTGALTALPFSPIALGPGFWSCVAVHPSGSPVVVGDGGYALASFEINATTAIAAAGSPYPMGVAGAVSCAFSHEGHYVYSGGFAGNYFAGFSVNPTTGVLTPLSGSPFDSGGENPKGYVTDAAGRLFMLTRFSQLRAFTTAGGLPTAVAGNPFVDPGFADPLHAVRHPSGMYMAADWNSNRVSVSRITGSESATTMTAVAGPFATGGALSQAVALTQDGSFLVAANGDSRNLTVFQVNPATGALALAGVQPANTLGTSGNVSGLVFVPVVPPFIDDPMTALTSVVKAVHITELRSRIDSVRAQYGLGPYAYTDPTLSAASTLVRAVHVTDLRAALAEVYVALGMAAPGYTDPTLSVGATVVKLAHIMELRAAVVAIE